MAPAKLWRYAAATSCSFPRAAVPNSPARAAAWASMSGGAPPTKTRSRTNPLPPHQHLTNLGRVGTRSVPGVPCVDHAFRGKLHCGELTCGLLRINAGKPVEYRAKQHEFLYVMEGSCTLVQVCRAGNSSSTIATDDVVAVPKSTVLVVDVPHSLLIYFVR